MEKNKRDLHGFLAICDITIGLWTYFFALNRIGGGYNARGEQQLVGYLENYHVNKGYMLSFNFNQNKEVGLHTIQIGDKTIVEAVV